MEPIVHSECWCTAKKQTIMKGPIICLGLILSIFTGASAQWTAQTSGTSAELDAIYFKDALNGFASEAFTRTLETTDGGKTWTLSSSQGFRDFSFSDKDNGFGASVVSQSMGKTSNGGASWSRITPPTSNSLWAVAATSSSTAYFVGTGGVLWKTTNGGASVSVKNSGTSNLLTDIVFTNSTTGYLVVQNGIIKKTTNSGQTWSTVKTISGVLLTEMTFVNEQVGYVVGSGGTVLKTSNAGQTWTSLSTNSAGYLQGVNFFDEDNGIAVGLGGEIIRTSDGGTTWITETSGVGTHLKDVFMLTKTSAIVIGDDGVILRNGSLTAGVKTIEEIHVNAYPNPIVNQLTISSETELVSVQVYNQIGELLSVPKMQNSDLLRLDFTNQSSGAYLVAIEPKRGRLVRRVVK
jgi:photosystem II stability/assembly factor-like uncharacterized protein